jgi:DNA-binding LytR/AlgR family response regulator
MIRCIAVDDEPKALDVISIHAAKIADVDLVKSFTDPEKALAFLNDNCIDLVLLDINMPIISGLQLAEQLQSKPHLIFTTAYSEFAIDGYNFEAVDYLLKPIEFQRFYKAINKVKKIMQLDNIQINNPLSKYIFVKDGYKQVKVSIDDILYIQSEGNYLNIVTSKEKVIARMTFQLLMEKLPSNLFFRIHNSFVINFSHIYKIEENHIFIQNAKIPIGLKYRDNVLKLINFD